LLSAVSCNIAVVRLLGLDVEHEAYLLAAFDLDPGS
jgi:hypothetical protein